MNDDLVQTVWRVATLPVRLVLQGLLWIFAPNGTPLRAAAMVLLIFVVIQLVQMLEVR